ncbi:MAG TPA: hypothetical protein VKE88_01150, partial [Candidatus Nanoarchaeia archaeon]|nr:hypothetical protein [Candidatus Nanoarchaeia archaeon]
MGKDKKQLEYLLKKYSGESVDELGEFTSDEATMEQKPRGYWSNIDNVVSEFEKIINKNKGKFPTMEQLRDLRLYGMLSAIHKNHGGLGNIQEKLGYIRTKKPNKYWACLENVITEIKSVMKEQKLESLPDAELLKKLNYSSLSYAITKHGGYHKIRSLFNENEKRAKNGVWKDEKRIKQEAIRVMAELNVDRLPSLSELNRLGHSDLANGIMRYHKGAENFRTKILGEEKLKNSHGIWRDKNYTKNEAIKAMKKLKVKVLPSSGRLCENGYSSLSNAITNYHGGFHQFRTEVLGEEALQMKAGLWRDTAYIKKQAMAAMKELKVTRLPSQDTLGKKGYSDLINGITRYHGGFHQFRTEVLGEEALQMKAGLWRDRTFRLNYAKQLLEKHKLKELPSQTRLAEIGESGFSAAISKYHTDGISGLRLELGEEQKKLPNGTWRDRTFRLNYAKQLLEKHKLKKLPSQTRLAEIGESGLASAIATYHKQGFRGFRKDLGQEHIRVENGFWKNEENRLNYAKQLLEKHKLKELPSEDELNKMGEMG